ncbi:MAG: sulfite exporter TauE/SafE family protein [Acidimicrobiales bacterium]
MTGTELALALVIVTVGATVQGTIGFGQALVAAPLLLLVDTRLVPGPITVTAMALNLLMLSRDRGHADHTGLPWAVAGLLPGTLLASVALAYLSDGALAVLAALIVLAGVGLSAIGLRVDRNRRSLGVAGFVSGFMGTTAGIGGPPVALLYQHAGGPALRATLSRFFVAAAAISLVALVPAGRLGRTELAAGASMVPGAVCGFFLARGLRGRFDAQRTRTAVLALSAASALVVLVRAAL